MRSPPRKKSLFILATSGGSGVIFVAESILCDRFVQLGLVDDLRLTFDQRTWSRFLISKALFLALRTSFGASATRNTSSACQVALDLNQIVESR